ncbi:type II toxin-antitoxin system RelE/ParE family toxin [Marinicella gelatinilytica]|uniref:type II toxin-antitoxin system RelE/ParE family toxin n=1 Tax=Marinicella gelatinilytica TaxID=2996017 RepID=UPI003898F8B0
MPKSLILTPHAENDFLEAYDWYESQNLGLGTKFARCVDEKIASILVAPYHYQVIYKDIVRRALVNRFPFSIYFVNQSDCISIFAILNQHRNPEFWKSRI